MMYDTFCKEEFIGYQTLMMVIYASFDSSCFSFVEVLDINLTLLQFHGCSQRRQVSCTNEH